MPPRYAYWTIIAGGLPTAFRAADRDELLPTFQRIKEKHPDAQMKYFARGKLWESQDAARAAQTRGGAWNRGGERHGRPGEGGRERDRRTGTRPDQPGGERPRGTGTRPDHGGRERPRGTGARPDHAGRERPRGTGARPDQPGGERERRSRDWRPGGEHRDPRQKFIDAKKQRNAAMRQERWQRKNTEGGRGQGSGFRRGQGNNREGDRPAGNRFEGKRFEGKRPEGKRFEGTRPEGKKPNWKKRPDARWRPAAKKPWMRGQGTEEPAQPPRPQGPNREPRPSEEPKPAPPPKPEQPITPPPGPPERGLSRRPFRPAGKYPKRPPKA